MHYSQLILLVVATLPMATAVIWILRALRTKRLRARFGPEYERTVQESGSAARGERQLQKLEKRVEEYDIHPLTPSEKDRFIQNWRRVQARFVDDPGGALEEADRLLTDVMAARGYPLADFEELAANLLVNHAPVVEHYRSGHEIALRQTRGRPGTEALRQAMIHYRKLFDELVGEAELARSRTAAV